MLATPGTSEVDLRQTLMQMAVESWKLTRLFDRVLQRLDAGEATRYVSQLRYHLKTLEGNLNTAGLRLVNLEGHPYDAGMAATALNLGDFGPTDTLVVDQMLEPIIMGAAGVMKTGTVVLRRMTP